MSPGLLHRALRWPLYGGLLVLGACQGAADVDESRNVPVGEVSGPASRERILVDQDVPGAPTPAAEPAPAEASGAPPAAPVDLDDPEAAALVAPTKAAVMRVTATLDDGELSVTHDGVDNPSDAPTLLGLRLTVVGPGGYRQRTDLPVDSPQHVSLAAETALADGLYTYVITARYPEVSGIANGSHPATDHNGRRAGASEVLARQRLPLISHASGAFQVVDGDIVEAEDEPTATNSATSQ